MASTQAVWGIDLGRCALKAVRLRAAADDKVEILAHDTVEHAKILTQPDADRGELIAAALEKFLSRNDVSKDRIVVGVPGQHTLARFTKLPPVASKRIPDIVRYEADQQIPFDMDEVIWDFQTFQQEGMPDLEVGIFAMKRELIREHLLHFEQASIEPVAVQCGPLAVYNAAVYDGILGDETTILMDIGAENTDLIIATPSSFWTRTVPIGGNNFTEALVKSFKLSFSKAESLKRTAASSKYARQIFQAMRPVFADLVQELQRSMGFYASTHRDTKIEKVVSVGNAGKLPGLRKYLEQNLSLTVESPESFKRSILAGGVGGGDLKEDAASLVPAYGLALQGLDLGKVTSNLLPTEIAKQVVWKKKKPTFAAAAACLVIAAGLVWFRYSTDMSALAAGSETPSPSVNTTEEAWGIVSRGPSASLSDRARAKAVLEAGNKLKNALSGLTGQGDREREQTESLIEILGNKTYVARILEAVHRSVPVPEGPIGEAQTAEALQAAIRGGGGMRDERRIVHIERLDMRFLPNLNSIVWESMIPVEPPINDEDSDLPGIKVEITCTSPHKDRQQFVNESFMSALRVNGRKAGLGFFFDRVYLFSGMPKRVPGGAGVEAGDADSAKYDPVTDEAVVEDWRFVIWVDVVPGDYPEEEVDVDEDEEGGD